MSNDKAAPSVGIVIPAFNEAERIGAVLDTVTEPGLADCIVVVDDGSTDGTAEVAAAYERVRVICTPRNLGKGGALQAGFASTDAEIVCTIDADLTGLAAKHLRDLIAPLLEEEDVAMTVGKFVGGRKRTDWAQGLVKSISGQRAMRRTFIETLPDLTTSGFGVEALVTKHAKSIGARVEIVPLKGLSQVMKEEKLGIPGGVKSRLKMYADIAEHSLPARVRKGLPQRTKRP